MSKPVIAVDLDDVLSDSAISFIEYCNKQWGLSLAIEDYDEHIADMLKVEEAEADRRIEHYHESGASTSYRHDKDAVYVLRELSKQYKLVITTSRRRKLESVTRQWLEECYPDIFEDIHFAGIWDSDHIDRKSLTKAALCTEIGASYLIDDQPKHSFAAAGVGVKSLLFGDYPWNRSVDLAEGVTRVKNWQEVLEYFNGQ